MNDISKVARAGTLLSIERGCYSDYGVIGFFVVLKDFEPMQEIDAYGTEHPEQKDQYNFNDDQFLGWLLAKGLVLEIPYGRFHLSDYGSLAECNYHPLGDTT